MSKLLYLLSLCLNFYLLKFFIKIAKKKHIVAVGNTKNLHKGIIPRGAGIVFGFIYLLIISIGFFSSQIQPDVYYPLFLCSFLFLVLGFLDDIYDLRALTKLFFQFIIILLLTIYFYNFFNLQKYFINEFLLITLITIFGIWILNPYNFMDGSDGHLSSLTCVQCILIFIAHYINDSFLLMIPVIALFSLLFTFLKFNWYPAKVFMGDAGSLFLGINFLIYAFISIELLSINPFLILIIFSYFLTDTLGTLILRLCLKKNLKERHVSHPYQKFSRIYNHSKTAKCLIYFHLLWLLPLLILTNEFPNYQHIFLLIATIPSIVFLIKFGPTSS